MKSDPFEIEPLSEERWAAIEERVFEQLDSSPLASTTAQAPPSVGRSWWPSSAFVAAPAVLAVTLFYALGDRDAAVPLPIASEPSPSPSVLAAAASSHTEVVRADPAGAATSAPLTKVPSGRWPAPRASAPPVTVPPVAPADEEVAPVADSPRSLPPSNTVRRDEFDHAAGLEATAPADALARYHELARGADSWAANALFAEGRLALDRGDRARGEGCLHDYIRRFPGGPNLIDARALLERDQKKAP